MVKGGRNPDKIVKISTEMDSEIYVTYKGNKLFSFDTRQRCIEIIKENYCNYYKCEKTIGNS